jgi:hypothetical protein
MVLVSQARADEVHVRDVVNRIGLGVVAGDGWNARYIGNRLASRALSAGLYGDIVIGVDNFGIVMSAGLAFDGGTAAAPELPSDPMWLVELGIGLEVAPYAIVAREQLELRLHLGMQAVVVQRNGCDRCTMGGEPDLGIVGSGYAGALAWFGPGRSRGLGIDVVLMRGHLGDVDSGKNSVQLSPPAWLVRATWLPFRGRRK